MTQPQTRRLAQAAVIGGSAGSLAALKPLLAALPPTCAFPVAVVVHQAENRRSLLREILGRATSLTVREAEDKDPLSPGVVYLAPAGYHMLIEKDHTLSLSVDAPVHFSRPSIDVLFTSAAEAFGPGLVGVLLSGASADGAAGLRAIEQRGGATYIQSPESAEVDTMPSAGIALSPNSRVLPLPELVDVFRTLAGASSKESQGKQP